MNINEREIVRQFLATISRGGIKPRDYSFAPLIDGRLHRFPIEGDKGSEKSGGYCVYTDKRPAGWAKDFRQNITVKWSYDLSDEEKREYAQQQNNPEARAVAEKERREAERKKTEAERLQKENQQRALDIVLAEYKAADSDFHKHQYIQERFTDKGIFIPDYGVFSVRYNNDYSEITRFPVKFCNGTLYGGKLQRGDLIVPFVNVVTGKLQTLQRIPSKRNERGKFDKWFYGGLNVPGAAHILMPDNGEKSPLALCCEGFITGLSVLLITGGRIPVYCVGGCNNYMHVCRALRTRYPKKKICIFADNDLHGKGRKTAEDCISAGLADDYKIPPRTGEDFYDVVSRKAGY